METKIEINRLNTEFDFSLVPSWYAICTNGNCPFKQDCLRYLAGSNAPESLDTALCVMPHMANDGNCRLFDKKNVVVMAAGFTTLYDQVLKKDYTSMRKAITRYLHGAKMYYEYKDGKRGLNPEQQKWIRNFVSSQGYDFEVKFDRFFEAYVFHRQAGL